MKTYAARLKETIEEADYDFVPDGNGGWRCQDALDCEVVAEDRTLGGVITKAAGALGFLE